RQLERWLDSQLEIGALVLSGVSLAVAELERENDLRGEREWTLAVVDRESPGEFLNRAETIGGAGVRRVEEAWLEFACGERHRRKIVAFVPVADVCGRVDAVPGSEVRGDAVLHREGDVGIGLTDGAAGFLQDPTEQVRGREVQAGGHGIDL